MILSAAQQATTPHTLRLALALASAHTGPGFTLPGSGKEEDPGLGAVTQGTDECHFFPSSLWHENNGLRSWG
jgi:hypothetical protein